MADTEQPAPVQPEVQEESETQHREESPKEQTAQEAFRIGRQSNHRQQKPTIKLKDLPGQELSLTFALS